MNYDEYLDLVVQTIAKNTKTNSQPLTAAALGGLLRQACPEQNWKAFGKRSLSELLNDLVRQGKISLVNTDKEALAVVVNDGAPQSVIAIEKFNPLRKSIWDAFMLVSPKGRRFMHRRDGTVRVALDIAPSPADDWLEILPIGIDRQREWARDFISEGHSDHIEASKSISDGNWQPQMFVRLLKETDESLAHLWNRYRSAKVSTIVQDWLTHNVLPPELAFQSSPPTRPPAAVNSLGGEIRVASQSSESEDVRRAILAALASLPLEKLLEISIPAGVMLTALSAAKLR